MVFKKRETKKVSAAEIIRKKPPSIISADLHIVGDLEGDGEIQVEGRVDGNIRCESLTLGETGQVEGEIIVNTLRVFGTITDSVRAHTVSMLENARMIGDVAHQKIEIRAGALVDGLYKHLKPEDSERRGERFKDVTPPELPKKAVPHSGKSDDAQSKPATKQEEPAKALH
ncbi:MAG: polymer-forming cytoskeletal protein [Pseudomonadota bacterium]|nr:polymer-forming cytoskeletal protein [Pseudomonadota bacterium]